MRYLFELFVIYPSLVACHHHRHRDSVWDHLNHHYRHPIDSIRIKRVRINKCKESINSELVLRYW